MLKSGGQLELAGVITIELASSHPSTATKNGFDLALEWPLELGGIQEAIFVEKIFRIFSTKKSSFILATTSKQDYIWISY